MRSEPSSGERSSIHIWRYSLPAFVLEVSGGLSGEGNWPPSDVSPETSGIRPARTRGRVVLPFPGGFPAAGRRDHGGIAGSHGNDRRGRGRRLPLGRLPVPESDSIAVDLALGPSISDSAPGPRPPRSWSFSGIGLEGCF